MTDTEFISEPGRQDVIITRVLDAPPEKVFRAVTEPELIAKWWGPPQYQTVVDELDARPGGRWRFIHRGDRGEYGFRGVFHEVVPPERIVQTAEFEGAPGHVSLETLTLEDADGKTRYVARAVHQSVAARDAAVGSGMESGARETMDRLAELVKRL